eukprot:299877-Rhodomonas_salina.1
MHAFPTSLRTRSARAHAMPGADTWCAAALQVVLDLGTLVSSALSISLRTRYAMCGTALSYGATPSTVLSSRMVLSDMWNILPLLGNTSRYAVSLRASDAVCGTALAYGAMRVRYCASVWCYACALLR